MKVIYFAQHFPTPQQGGAIRPYQMAKQLIARGHQVTIVCGGNKEFDLTKVKDDVERGDIDGIDVVHIIVPYSNNMSLLQRTNSFIKYTKKSIGFALREEYDLLFATSTPLTSGLIGVVMKMFRKKPFIFEVRDLWPELPKALGMKNPFFLFAMNVIEKWSYHRADGCIGLSPGICDGIRRRSQNNKPIEMVPNGCDLDIFNIGDRTKFDIEGIKPTDKVGVFTGAHGIANGLDSILDAAVVLKAKGREDIKFAFVGDGKVKQTMVERAEKEGLTNCLFFPPVSKFKIAEIIANADFGLMCLKNVPAFYYGTSPNKFFDYIASGLPILNNYPGWLSDLITDNKCGVVVAPDDAEAFANAAIQLADDSEVRNVMGKNGRTLAERKFNRNILGERFVNFFEKIHLDYYKK